MRKFNEVGPLVGKIRCHQSRWGRACVSNWRDAAGRQKAWLAFASRSSRYGKFAGKSTHSTQHTKLHPLEPGCRARTHIIAIPISLAQIETYICIYIRRAALVCLPYRSRGQIKFGSVCSFRARLGKLFRIWAITLIPRSSRRALKECSSRPCRRLNEGRTFFECESPTGTSAADALWMFYCKQHGINSTN